MNTSRVDICYRPLRVAWALSSDDRTSFDYAVRASYTMWGGRYNPIILVDRPEADRLVEVFRADMIVPLGTAPAVAAFAAKYPHLRSPLLPNSLFLPERQYHGCAQILDIHNALIHWHDTPEWVPMREALRAFSWDDDDPLAGVFQIMCGAYPNKNRIHIDYADLVAQIMSPHSLQMLKIDKAKPVDVAALESISFAYLSKHQLRRHYTIRASWDRPGFYVGDAGSIVDLANFWNLRASDVSLMFFDPRHAARYDAIRPHFEARTRANLAKLRENRRRIAVYSAAAHNDEAGGYFPDGDMLRCPMYDHFWSASAAPMMILGEERALGIVSEVQSRPRVSFAFQSKPFADDAWFHTQHLVASIDVSNPRFQDAQHIFQPPYVPDLNGTYAEEMNLRGDRIRIEPERIGMVINATDHDSYLDGLPTTKLAEKVFEFAGLTAKPSRAGVLARQLITQMGGNFETRAFKIPGVRKLIKEHGPQDTFTMREALRLIGKTPTFADHEDLHIEAREPGTKLKPDMVFSQLVAKGLFRLGARLECPSCTLPSFIPLDQLQQRNTCELCGHSYDGTRQLVGAECRYRRSGILGVEKNVLGAVPVALLLQQISANTHTHGGESVYLTSFNLTDKADPRKACETDFVMILPQTPYPKKPALIIGESKDEGDVISEADVDNMDRISRQIPKHRFDTYVLFSKLAPFTVDEIARIKPLNGEYESRVIMLSQRELEPFHPFEWTQEELGFEVRGHDPEDLANATTRIYFTAPTPAA